MRGKPSIVAVGKSEKGITPAHAGKTPLRKLCTRQGQDHPRACGENLVKVNYTLC